MLRESIALIQATLPPSEPGRFMGLAMGAASFRILVTEQHITGICAPRCPWHDRDPRLA